MATSSGEREERRPGLMTQRGSPTPNQYLDRSADWTSRGVNDSQLKNEA